MKKIITKALPNAPKKRKLPYAIFGLLLILCSISCKKETKKPVNNNEIKATIVTSDGTININAKGTKALMGCASFGGGTYIDGTDISNAGIYIGVSAGLACINDTGTYSNVGFEYLTDVSSNIALTYSNYGSSNPGSITFTVINDHYMEGYFSAVCQNNNGDSVIVNGTFKGDHLTN